MGSSEKLEMRGSDPRTSCKLSERSTIWAASPLKKRGANAISNLSSVNAIVERSSFAYRSKIGFVDACHQSMCFSHASRLPFRLKCLTGGVQRSYFFHTEVFISLISRVMCPSTSLWGEPWGFGAPIAFSACSVLFQMLLFAYWTYKPMSSFGLTNSCPYFVFRFPGSSEKLEMRGIALRTSRLLSERSTIWATSPLRKRGTNANFNLPSVNALLERSFLHIALKMALSLRAINPCVSHMPIACTFDWDASLVVSRGAIYFIRRSLILLSAE